MVGDPTTIARVFNLRNSDELIFLDIDASKMNKKINFDVIEDIAKECFMPLTIGGGIQSIDDVDRLFAIGADKVSLNTQAIYNKNLILEIASKYGSQSVVVSIDLKLEENTYYIYTHGGTIKSEKNFIDYLKELNQCGIGEILINSINKDGTLEGYDLELLNLAMEYSKIPIIISGGCGSLEDCYLALEKGADAISAASIFYYVGESAMTVNKYLRDKKIPVRNTGGLI